MKRANIALLTAAGAFWIYYFCVHKVPLNADEVFFSHIFWMMREGLVPFIDFHSRALPFYFDALMPLLPEGNGPEFIYNLRVISVLMALPFFFMVRPALWAALLLFVIFGRVAEIRPDTVGLILFNLAWLTLLKDRKYAALAAVLAAGALFFSARAALMMVPMAALCLYLVWPRRWPLIAAGCGFILALGALWAANPAYYELVVRGVYFDNAGILTGGGGVGYVWRFLEPERAVLLVLILSALIRSAVRMRRERLDRDLVIVVACISQLSLVVIDPDPYGYAYSWAAIPTLAGLPPVIAVVVPAGVATLLVLASLTSSLWRSAPPPPGHVLSITPAPTMSERAVASATTAELASTLMKGQSLQGQLRTRWELCRRLQGEVVLSYWWYHPICLRDALHDWIFLRRPQGFDTLKAAPPALVVWGERGTRPNELLQDHEQHDGFALRRQRPVPKP